MSACGRSNFDRIAGDASGDGAPMVGDSAADASLLTCADTHPDATLCYGFEGAGMGPFMYTVVEQGQVGRSMTRAYRGSASLEAEVFAASVDKFARWGSQPLPRQMSGDIYTRAYYWLPSTTMVTGQLSLVVIGDSAPPYPGAYVRLEPNEIVIAAGGIGYRFTQDFPRDRWVCFEFHVRVDVNGLAEVTLDGGAPLVSSTVDTTIANGYHFFDVGIHYASVAQAPAVMWVDEVVVDDVPIGCN